VANHSKILSLEALPLVLTFLLKVSVLLNDSEVYNHSSSRRSLSSNVNVVEFNYLCLKSIIINMFNLSFFLFKFIFFIIFIFIIIIIFIIIFFYFF